MGWWLIIEDQVTTQDGSNTLYSKEYEQHFHNIKDGAVYESFEKHVSPALIHHKEKLELKILDICFGLGYNTLVTIDTIKKQYPNKKLQIFSPELDRHLVHSLQDFVYPQQLQYLQPIIEQIARTGKYKDEKLSIEIYFGDAREYIKELKNIDIVYQDPFSSDKNIELWTQEYFSDIKKILNNDAIVTTYSIATPVRLSMSEAGLQIYEFTISNGKKSTLGFLEKQNRGKYIDMELKKLRNPNAKALRDQ